MSYVLAIDEGTTGVRAMVVDGEGRALSTAYWELSASYPRPGWVECDPEQIWLSTQAVCHQACREAGCSPRELSAIGITNQRSSVVAWDARTSKPVYPAIIWQDVRTAARAAELMQQGLFTTAMASATKLEWILKSVPEAAALAARGDLRLGTVDSWLAWKLSDGQVHATDASNASCTTLYDHVGGGWDANALGLLGIPAEALPPVRGTSEVYGTSSEAALGATVPIASLAGDQQAAMFAELGLERGAIKITFGTSGMLDINTGEYPVFSTRGAYPLILWSLAGERTYCLEGTVVTAGAAVQWLRDGLGVICSLEESAQLAAQVEDSGGVWFVPAFQGLGTPHMVPEARASFGGLSRASSKAHVARAVLEGIAFRTREVLDTLIEEVGVSRPSHLRVDGGAASNDLLLQLVADTVGVVVERPACVQASALGAAYLAGIAAGVWPNVEALRQSWRSGATFSPRTDDAQRAERFARWRRVVAAIRELP